MSACRSDGRTQAGNSWVRAGESTNPSAAGWGRRECWDLECNKQTIRPQVFKRQCCRHDTCLPAAIGAAAAASLHCRAVDRRAAAGRISLAGAEHGKGILGGDLRCGGQAVGGTSRERRRPRAATSSAAPSARAPPDAPPAHHAFLAGCRQLWRLQAVAVGGPGPG